MCLATVDEKKRKFSSNKLQRGWKVVEVEVPYLEAEFSHFKFRPGWNKAVSSKSFEKEEGYIRGFHIWKTRKAARKWNSLGWNNRYHILPVYFYPSQVVATGTQSDNKVIVTSKMFIKKADYQKTLSKRK